MTYDQIKNTNLYEVQLFNDERTIITEKEAKVLCPKKLEAFQGGRDSENVEEDKEYIEIL